MKKKKTNIIWTIVVSILIATIITLTILLANARTANTELRNKLSLYQDYYKKAELLFDEIEDRAEVFFDTDRAADYLIARGKIKDNKFN